MITRLIRETVKYRTIIMVYLSGAADWNWNPTEECFVPSSIYLRWNAHLLLTLGSTFPILMTTFLLSKIPDGEYMESTGTFVIFILGWAEMFIVTSVLMIGLQLTRNWRGMVYMLNEMSRYSYYIEELMRRQNSQFNREEKKHLKKASMLLALTGVLCTFTPVAFAGCICVRMEPTHAMVQEWLEVNISFKPRFIPFILFMAWIVSNAASVIFSGINVGFQYILLARSLVTCLTPESATKIVQPGLAMYKVKIQYELNSRYFGILDEMTAVRMFRTQQVFNTIINEIFGGVLIAFHHVACMLAFLGGAYTLLQATDEALDGGPLVVAALVLAMIVPLVLQYEEAKEISELCQKADAFVGRCVNLTNRRSMLYKFARSCPKLQVHAGYPFFNVGKDTFTQFWAQGLDFLIDMLAV
ncbi:unnamed protein product [Orchesella dallaii]|uniref:Odorant receptor n=1 Tax=Orchesella dallaii TaxID=48710 RepID=A0ABP1S9T2_9HEXA